jgi:hypothetical protein
MAVLIPEGRVLDVSFYPFLVMQDDVGIFVLDERVRHYQLDIKHAREHAEHLSDSRMHERICGKEPV